MRVTPELIRVRDGVQQWSQSFDDELRDVFKVQSAIASNVSDALNVALGATAREQLARIPTSELPAYQEFLKGEQATELMTRNDGISLKQGLSHYERAVALDSNYALAWARIAMVHANNATLTYSRVTADLAHEAAARAAKLAPNDAMTLRARAQVARFVDKNLEGAAALLDSALRRMPSSTDVLLEVSRVESALSRYDSSIVHARRAVTLDPRNAAVLARLASGLRAVRRFAEADTVIAKQIAISPANISAVESQVINYVSLGDTAGITHAIQAALLAKAATNELIAYFALYQEMIWTLPVPLQRRLTTLRPAEFRNNRQQWALKVGRAWALLGDEAKARAYGDTAVTIAASQLSEFPYDAQIHELLARSLALAGRKAEAIEAAERSLKMRETALDASTGPYVRYQVARVLVQSGAYNRAMELLEPLLSTNFSDMTPAWLRLDPTFRPLRGMPRFERMTATR